MLRRILVAACAMAFPLSAVPATAAQEGAGQPAPTEARKDITVIGDKEKKTKRICKTSVSTGSIMPKRVCRTVDDWDTITEKSKLVLDQMRQQQTTNRLIRDTAESQ